MVHIGLFTKYRIISYIITEICRTFRAVDPNANSVVHQVTSKATSAAFQINNAKLYVLIVTKSINDNINFLENIKYGFKQ